VLTVKRFLKLIQNLFVQEKKKKREEIEKDKKKFVNFFLSTIEI
jgi:hypothetical protein